MPALREPLTVPTWIWHSGVTVANPSHPFPHPSSYRQHQAVAGAPAAPTPCLCLRSARPCCGAVRCEPVASV